MNAGSVLITFVGSAALSTAASASASLPNEATTIELRGRCDYRPEVREGASPGTGFALCSSIRIQQNGSDSVIDFRQSLGGSEFRYEGTWTGDGMAIAQLSIKGRPPKDANGDCTIFRNAGKISAVTCVAKIDWKTFAANFVASRINP